MKNKYPITLLIRGDVQAYSPEQIEDRVKKHLYDSCEYLFGVMLPYHLVIGQGKPITSGIASEELQKRIAYELYWYDRVFKRQLAKELEVIAKNLYDESGIIFKDVKAIKAATELKTYLNNLRSSVSHPDDNPKEWYKSPPHHTYLGRVDQELKDPEQIKHYMEVARQLMDATYQEWRSQLIVPEDLLKEVSACPMRPKEEELDAEDFDES